MPLVELLHFYKVPSTSFSLDLHNNFRVRQPRIVIKYNGVVAIV